MEHCELVKPNSQLYENRPDVQAQVEEYLGLATKMHGAKPPNLVIAKEKPEHRLILLLKAKGMSNREIAQETGYTDAWLSQLTRQPWFQTRLCELLGRAQDEIVDGIARVEAANSMFKLVHLRDHAKSEPVQADCAKEILNRFQGKPTTRVETVSVSSVLHVSTKLEDIDKQLKTLEEEEQALLHEGTDIESEPCPAGD